ncbi:hypothetical protein MIMGU_mgv1a023220mg, partial [Erythranthe guttata]
WSLIAARLPGRTDNEVKNYWNYHLSKKVSDTGVLVAGFSDKETKVEDSNANSSSKSSRSSSGFEDSNANSKVNDDDFFDFSNESPSTLIKAA